MSIFTIIGMILGAWAMLSVVGSQRQSELDQFKRSATSSEPEAPTPVMIPGQSKMPVAAIAPASKSAAPRAAPPAAEKAAKKK